MSNEILSMSLSVEELQKRVLSIDKSNINAVELIKNDTLELLSKLKRKQDDIIMNEDDENAYEDLVSKVIVVLGEFDTNL